MGATNALRGLKNFDFLGRKLRISYAKTKSDALARAQGVYKPRTREEKKPDKKPAVTQVAAPGRGTVIFVENLPPDLTDSEPFKLLFEQYPGFTDVRLIAQRRVAFVEFTEQRQAEDAINGLQGFMFAPGYQLKLSYAK